MGQIRIGKKGAVRLCKIKGKSNLSLVMGDHGAGQKFKLAEYTQQELSFQDRLQGRSRKVPKQNKLIETSDKINSNSGKPAVKSYK